MSTDTPSLLTKRQVATRLGVSPGTIANYLRAGALPPPIRMSGPRSHPRWPAEQIEAWWILKRTAAGGASS